MFRLIYWSAGLLKYSLYFFYTGIRKRRQAEEFDCKYLDIKDKI